MWNLQSREWDLTHPTLDSSEVWLGESGSCVYALNLIILLQITCGEAHTSFFESGEHCMESLLAGCKS
jgi:hypothetical protein